MKEGKKSEGNCSSNLRPLRPKKNLKNKKNFEKILTFFFVEDFLHFTKKLLSVFLLRKFFRKMLYMWV